MLILTALATLVGHCAVPPSPSQFTVIIDPGHGGKDQGAPAIVQGRFEKEATLRIARLIAARLSLEKDTSAILTRDNDLYLSLAQRRNIITSCKADLVVSIHADSGPITAQGPSIYVLNEAGEAIVVNRMTSKYPYMPDNDTAYILANLEQRASINLAAKIAARVRRRLGDVAERIRVQKTANFALLKSPGVPSILIETGFVTNLKDAMLLFNVHGQSALADAIAGPIIESAMNFK
ncbi:N-acetylmuramoyl-L-alanine amidase [Sphingomonas sp. PB2P19]|uniref:N-acetylmuramoyl-L-alanine amidase family protein n=1 Tax=Sphingomonas rhamnosi TaxID=3096156 RepID=UPI002FCBC5D8